MSWPDKDDNDFEPMKELQPVASFQCLSGYLLWGHLENVMESKLNFEEKGSHVRLDCFNDTRKHEVYHHHFITSAKKGRWNKFTWDPVLYDFHYEKWEDGTPMPPEPYRAKHTFLLHESMSPYQFLEEAKCVHYLTSPRDNVVYVHANDWGWLPKTRFGPDWKTYDTDVLKPSSDIFLTDPEWEMTLPPAPPPRPVSCKEAKKISMNHHRRSMAVARSVGKQTVRTSKSDEGSACKRMRTRSPSLPPLPEDDPMEQLLGYRQRRHQPAAANNDPPSSSSTSESGDTNDRLTPSPTPPTTSASSSEGDPAGPPEDDPSEEAPGPEHSRCQAYLRPGMKCNCPSSSDEEEVDDSFDRDPEVKNNVITLMDKLKAKYTQANPGDVWLKNSEDQVCGLVCMEGPQELNARLVFTNCREKKLVGFALEENETGWPMYCDFTV